MPNPHILLAIFKFLGNSPVMETSKIKRLRLEHGMTLADLAAKVGLSEGHMSRVEAGTRGLRFAKLDTLARVLGVPVAELAGRHETISRADVIAYAPPKGSVVEKALASSSQRMFRVLSGVLSELSIVENDLIVAETNETACKSIETGKAVVVSITDGDGNGILLLRQYIAPHLLITNSLEQNALPLHLQRTKARIIGLVLT